MQRENCIDTIAGAPATRSFGLPPWIALAVQRLGAWTERSRQRRQLAELDDAALKDIGLTRTDVRTEADKPFWVV